jgi:uncharacterized damage-inducible protein DinB
MTRPPELRPFYDAWADQQRKLVETIEPLTPEQMQLRPAPSEWAIWQLASNMAGGRLYWLCYMLREDRLGVSGWKEDHPLTADELVGALNNTWTIVEACLDRWSLSDLSREVTREDLRGELRTITPGWVINRLMSHEYHHGSEIALILRMHGLPTAIAG